MSYKFMFNIKEDTDYVPIKDQQWVEYMKLKSEVVYSKRIFINDNGAVDLEILSNRSYCVHFGRRTKRNLAEGIYDYQHGCNIFHETTQFLNAIQNYYKFCDHFIISEALKEMLSEEDLILYYLTR